MKKCVTLIAALVLILTSCSEKPKPPIEWKSIERSLQTEFISVADNDTISLPEGHFMFTKSLTMDGKTGIVIHGQGMDKTILSFKNQTEGAQGIHVSNGKNITMQDFAVEDAKGDNIKVSETRGITFRRVRASWTGEPSSSNGAYAIYPVMCQQVLMEECEAIGSSDAGIMWGNRTV